MTGGRGSGAGQRSRGSAARTAADDAWEPLARAEAPTRGEFRVIDAGVRSSEGPALRALDSEGMRHLLIPTQSDAVVEADERSSGVHIRGRELEEAGAGRVVFVDLACRKPHLARVFSALVDEVLAELALDPGRPARVARRVLNRWRELLERELPGVMSPEALVGLFGELRMLRRLVRHDPRALESWIAPAGGVVDFQNGRIRLEVKTTTARQGLAVEIHGVDQLDVPAGTELLLAILTVDRTPGAGESVPALVDDIRALGPDPVRFAQKLYEAGYADADAPHYAEERFTVRDEFLYAVDDQFPRLIRTSFVGNDLPNKVRRLTYTLDLTEPPPAALEYDAGEAALRRLVPDTDR